MKVVVEMDVSRCVDFSSLIFSNNRFEYRLVLCIGLGQEDEKGRKEKKHSQKFKVKGGKVAICPLLRSASDASCWRAKSEVPEH